LREFGVRRVQVSVYSDIPAVHDAITRFRIAAADAGGDSILLEHGLQVKLACPLMQENLMAYRGVMALAEKLGIPYILDLTITPMMDGSADRWRTVPRFRRCCRCCRCPAACCKPQPGAQTASAVNDSPPRLRASFERHRKSGLRRFALQRGP